eukprot:CAMPEP_0119115724 /NCGR_PEP_ID=MMETSP1180-20130426/51899_1 /TAXON_ID=3052 ORGANISM="Chlamydomonas cf sp, Strain CCMP681" /NCGR_SAMPLE_ID=MMETSP1180 /ASSEMBLY_ACC=CAM_ASM_000741 /LENGTH=259 /DNA_ID=CAMNT_0007104813 /DNA_START=96 /DNA_END=875 /DNA_ORIENTATION=-
MPGALPMPRTAAAVPTSTRQPARCVHVSSTAKVTGAGTKAIPIAIQGRRLQVTDAIKAYIQEKIAKTLSKFAQEVKNVDVSLSARGGDTGTHGKKEQKVDVTIHTVRNGIVRVEDSEGTLYASIDLVADKIDRKMVKLKERAISKGKWAGHAGPRDQGQALEEAAFKEYQDDVQYETSVFDQQEAINREFATLNKDFPPIVYRTKVVRLDPMSTEDAIEAMEALGHDFYMYQDVQSRTMQVVYRRATQGYGVLVPESKA